MEDDYLSAAITSGYTYERSYSNKRQTQQNAIFQLIIIHEKKNGEKGNSKKRVDHANAYSELCQERVVNHGGILKKTSPMSFGSWN